MSIKKEMKDVLAGGCGEMHRVFLIPKSVTKREMLEIRSAAAWYGQQLLPVEMADIKPVTAGSPLSSSIIAAIRAANAE